MTWENRSLGEIGLLLSRGKHINYLEILAVWFPIKSFAKDKTNCHIKILIDNQTTVAYLNHMGGTKEYLNALTREIWLWCHKNGNYITASHLPGKINTAVDKESGSQYDNMEWKLNSKIFYDICELFGRPEIDLFANRLNHQCDMHFSWKPNPGAKAVDALSNC